MTIYTLPEEVLKSDYKGCGRAWAAINSDRVVIALRYMEAPLQKRLDATMPLGFVLERPGFQEYRLAAKAELAALGTVISGECSCTEFVA